MTWMKQIFFSSIFLSENTGRLAKHAGYPGHDFWHTLYFLKIPYLQFFLMTISLAFRENSLSRDISNFAKFFSQIQLKSSFNILNGRFIIAFFIKNFDPSST